MNKTKFNRFHTPHVVKYNDIVKPIRKLKDSNELNKIIDRYNEGENIYIQMRGEIYTGVEFKKRYEKVSEKNNLWLNRNLKLG